MKNSEEAREALYSVGDYIDKLVADNDTLSRINSKLNSKVVDLQIENEQLKKELGR
jgi:predicted RNA-binding protein Jag